MARVEIFSIFIIGKIKRPPWVMGPIKIFDKKSLGRLRAHAPVGTPLQMRLAFFEGRKCGRQWYGQGGADGRPGAFQPRRR